MRRVRTRYSGFSIIEVLLAATTFMIGLSILIALLNRTLVKFSIVEMELATALADEQMTVTMARMDTVPRDTIVERGGLRFALRRRVEVNGQLVQYSIIVAREITGAELIHLCNEILLPSHQ